MKKSEKKMIAILIIVAIIIVVVLALIKSRGENSNNSNTSSENTSSNSSAQGNVQTEEFVSQSPDGVRTNTSSKLHETKTYQGLEISNIQLTESNNVTDVLGTITNVSGEVIEGQEASLKVLDKDGNEMITLPILIPTLQPGDNTQLNTNATFDFANAYDYVIGPAVERPE